MFTFTFLQLQTFLREFDPPATPIYGLVQGDIQVNIIFLGLLHIPVDAFQDRVDDDRSLLSEEHGPREINIYPLV